MASNNNSSFHIFNYTDHHALKCTNAMNTSPSPTRSDAENTKLCCDELKCCFCWPLFLVFDILSCPFRLCIHCKESKNDNS